MSRKYPKQKYNNTVSKHSAPGGADLRRKKDSVKSCPTGRLTLFH
jgi:hypothetical protein